MKLKVHIIPIHLTNVAPEELEIHGIRKFLHLTPSDIKLSAVVENILVQFKRLYPKDGDLQIEKFQSFDKCDLDPEFFVDQALENGDSLRLIVLNQISDHDNSLLTPNRINNGVQSVTTVNGSDMAQSTPMVQPAPILVNKKRNAPEFFETVDSNIPTKKPNVTSEERQIEVQGNLSINFNQSNVSLLPPDTEDNRDIPQKKPQKPVGDKRVTSGMLNLPVHTQLETEQINSYMENTSKVNNADSESDSGDEEANPEPTLSQDAILQYLKTHKPKTNVRVRSNSETEIPQIPTLESKNKLNGADTRSNALLKSLQINMVPDKVYPRGGDRRRSNSRLDQAKRLNNQSVNEVIIDSGSRSGSESNDDSSASSDSSESNDDSSDSNSNSNSNSSSDGEKGTEKNIENKAVTPKTPVLIKSSLNSPQRLSTDTKSLQATKAQPLSQLSIDSSSDSESSESSNESGNDSTQASKSRRNNTLSEPNKPVLEKLASQSSPEKKEIKRFIRKINPPKLNSLSDLAKNGIPNVKEDKFKATSKALKDLHQSDNSDSSGSGSESESGSDSDSDSDEDKNVKFIQTVKKPKRNQGFMALMKDGRKKHK